MGTEDAPKRRRVQWSYEWTRAVRDRAAWGVELPPTTVLVLLVVATYADNEGGAVFASGPTLAKVTGLKPDTVYRALRLARRVGFLHEVQRGHGRGGAGQGRASDYWLTVPDWAPSWGSPVATIGPPLLGPPSQ